MRAIERWRGKPSYLLFFKNTVMLVMIVKAKKKRQKKGKDEVV